MGWLLAIIVNLLLIPGFLDIGIARFWIGAGRLGLGAVECAIWMVDDTEVCSWSLFGTSGDGILLAWLFSRRSRARQ
jgi:hypothetical protein